MAPNIRGVTCTCSASMVSNSRSMWRSMDQPLLVGNSIVIGRAANGPHPPPRPSCRPRLWMGETNGNEPTQTEPA